MNAKKTIQDILLEDGTITSAQYKEILDYASEYNISFIDAAQRTNHITDPRKIVEVLAKSLDLQYVNIRNLELDREVVTMISGQVARHFNVVPIESKLGITTFAVPLKSATNLQIKDDLQRATNSRHVEFIIAYGPDIRQTIEDHFRADDELREISEAAAEDAAAAAASSSAASLPTEIVEESKVAKFVELVLSQAIKDKASDIHFDPQEKNLVVRYRIDGILYPQTTAPASSVREIVSRVKVMADLDISDRRTPQDGRLSLIVEGKKIDFRIATLPSVYGEKIVMRILDNSSSSLPLQKLGFSEANYKRLETAALKPYGVVLVTGPTGSGKSTTLYSLLNRLNSPEKNIITAEDPVEYRLAGITQVQVNAKQGLTFERVLRTILRADPDIILVGEIRDEETASIALQAGMTGHMVFSTLHTNDAASALSRLSEMGVEGFMIASTLEAVVSQRLIRRLCEFCKEEYEPTELDLDAVNFPYEKGKEKIKLFKPVGCKECANTGYRGRGGVHEVLVVSDQIREAIIAGASSTRLDEIAKEEGMTSMKYDGFIKVKQGITTIEEVLRVVS